MTASDNRRPEMKPSGPLFLNIRLVLSGCLVPVAAVSHLCLGETHPGDGQDAFGFLLIFGIVGAVGAMIFAFAGTLAGWAMRGKSPRLRLLVEGGMFLMTAGVLTYGGITAKYHDNSPAVPAPPASP